MSSFTNPSDQSSRDALERHRRNINRVDARSSAFKEVPQMLQVSEETPTSTRVYHRYGNQPITHWERPGETQAMADRRTREAQERAHENWGLAQGAIHGSNAFAQAGQQREDRRSDATWRNPIAYGNQMMTGRRPVSPRSQRERQVATDASKTSTQRGPAGRESRLQQIGRETSSSGKQRARKRGQQQRSLRGDMREQNKRLERQANYYYGTLEDQNYQKILDEVESHGNYQQASPEEIHGETLRLYRERYPMSISRRSSSGSSSGSSSKSKKKAEGPSPLEISKSFINKEDHPKWSKCPITLEFMTDPVVGSTGITYERTSIKEWLKNHKTCPITRKPLNYNSMVPNMSLRHAIIYYYEKNGGKESGSSSSGKKAAKKNTRRGGRRKIPFSKIPFSKIPFSKIPFSKKVRKTKKNKTKKNKTKKLKRKKLKRKKNKKSRKTGGRKLRKRMKTRRN